MGTLAVIFRDIADFLQKKNSHSTPLPCDVPLGS